MARIAILHFTLLPAAGGIETLIEAQCSVLRAAGHEVITISGDRNGAYCARTIDEIHPEHPDVIDALNAMGGRAPARDHPVVMRLQNAIGEAIRGCDQCWVHNAFTVLLNPFLTVALRGLVDECQHIRWIGWCEDLTAITEYWHDMARADRHALAIPPEGIELVTISQARAAELAAWAGIARDRINVVLPPLNAYSWLDLSAESQRIFEDVGACMPLILVPAKALPHKRLEVAVRLADALRQYSRRPMVLVTSAPSPHDRRASERVRAGLHYLARQLGTEENVQILWTDADRIGRREVRDLMLLSDMVFLPSAEEGFGMPVLEAAALRVPTLCADIPAFRESGGTHVRYFPLAAHEEMLAEMVMEMAEAPANVARRSAIRSMERFRACIRAMVNERPLPDNIAR